MDANSVAFPTRPSATASAGSSLQPRQSVLSLSCHANAIEVCDFMYSASASSWDTISRFYEPSATYENPFVTATSRSMLSDIHSLAAHLSQIDVPRPLAALHAVFGMKRDKLWVDPWLRAVRVWNEIGDICESESIDGHRKIIVEHTLHVLLLPSFHSAASRHTMPPDTQPEASSSRALSLSFSSLQQAAHHSTLGLDLSTLSPLHLRLPITSRLSFNDAGKITYHRDIWDVKDLLGLVPGMSLAQWISGRLVAQGMRGLAWIGRSFLWPRRDDAPGAAAAAHRQPLADEEQGLAPAGAEAGAVRGETG